MLSDTIRVLCFVCCVGVLSITSAEVQKMKPPAAEFKRHRLVQPVLQHARTKRDMYSTRETSGAHHSEVTMRVPVDGEELILDLRLNQQLITDNHVLTYQENGNTVQHKHTKEELELCHYVGSVRDKPGSWVALSTCHGVQGTVFDGEKMRYIEPAQGADISSQHYLYEHADLAVSHKCGNEDTVVNDTHHNSDHHPTNDELQQSRILSRHARHAKVRDVVAPYNADARSRYVELVLVADYAQFLNYNRDIRAVHSHMITLANIVNSVYAPLNIFIALVGVEVWNRGDKIRLSSDSFKTLEAFVDYRSKELLRKMPNDNAHLVTGQKFGGGVVGKAYTGAICSSKNSGGVSNHHTDSMGLLAMTIAHEMGHNFGMEHDDYDVCECPDKNCIMGATSTENEPTHWSSCSMNALAYSFWKEYDYCLRNKPKYIFNSPTCGNGFVEPGEQCDCGLDWRPNNPWSHTKSVPRANNPCHACCDPNTCMLRANATCGAGMCCDLQTCRPKSAGTVCRSADRECDLPEYCSGDSEYCPDDVYKMDSTPCGQGEQSAYCVRGSCKSHTSQCRVVWGVTGNNAPTTCYHKNDEGTAYGNCGHNPLTDTYKKCDTPDVLCGRLQCTHLNSKTEMGSSRATIGTTTYTYGDTIIQCYVATIDVGLSDLDPGMVPDGAVCGDDMMCLNQQCVSVASVRQKFKNDVSSVCPSDCSGHGVCNSKGECHCEAGFAPPLCVDPGTGGSLTSGPATDPAIQRNFMLAMYVIFLGIVPLLALILFLIYHFRPGAFACCSDCLQQKLNFNNCYYRSVTKVKPPKNEDTKKLPKERPEIVHHLLNENVCKDSDNSLPKLNLQKKSNSVIYSNIVSIKSQKTVVVASSSNEVIYDSPDEPLYSNMEFGKLHKSNDDLYSTNLCNNLVNLPRKGSQLKTINIASSSNDSLRKNPVNVNLSSVHLRKTPNNVINSSNENLPKIAIKEDNSSNNRPSKAPVKVVNSSSHNLRKAPITPSIHPSKKLNNEPGNGVDFSNIKLRKTGVNIVDSPSDNLQSKDAINAHQPNVQLRKTPGDIVSLSNEGKSVNSSKANQKKAPISKPVRKINLIKGQTSSNK